MRQQAKRIEAEYVALALRWGMDPRDRGSLDIFSKVYQEVCVGNFLMRYLSAHKTS